jgi:hypothetical protein
VTLHGLLLAIAAAVGAVLGYSVVGEGPLVHPASGLGAAAGVIAAHLAVSMGIEPEDPR